jgi:carboxyl-terminal processing protease
MKVNPTYLPLVFSGILAFGILLGGWLDFPQQNLFLTKKNSTAKISKLLDFIDNEYVDEVNSDSITDKVIDNILAKLDPHSVYIPPQDQIRVVETMNGEFVGIGVNFYMYKDSLTILKPVKNGPADKAGIQSGDRILFVDNTKLYGRKLPTDSLFSKLKGKKGSEVVLTMYRKSSAKKFTVKITRDIIPIKSVAFSKLAGTTIGYIKINLFGAKTYDEFKTGLTTLQKQGVKSLVVDVRDNGGGYLEQAVAIADEFLKDKQLILFTKDKKGTVKNTYATKVGSYEQGTLFILINENSASASEILAGAIQDNDRGVIVGRRSFGKGLVQREIDFNDGSAVRLTVARYYTPTGRSIQKPYNKGKENYLMEAQSRFKNGELYDKDSIKRTTTQRFRTPKGKIVYGGGGIVPDIFVPIEVEQNKEHTSYLLQTGIVGQFVFEQLDHNRIEFKHTTFDQLKSKISDTDKYFEAFQKYLIKNQITISIINDKINVKKQLVAEFTSQLFDNDMFIELTLRTDPILQKVLSKN